MADFRKMVDVTRLPSPDPHAAALSLELTKMICTEIAASDGRITFARYMELALYAPGIGYYSAGQSKFGAAGDFVTAPELSPLFARCLARQTQQVLDAMAGGAVLEVGGGSGALVCDLISSLAAANTLPERYFILELSADLRERQQRVVAERLGELGRRVEWLDRLPQNFCGVVIANELVDAMPIHRLSFTAGRLSEVCIGWDGERFFWCLDEPSDARLATRVERILSALDGIYDEDYIFEINLAAEDWLRTVAAVVDTGLILLVDYGYPQGEYFHPQRRSGTLMCHYRHRVHSDPLIFPGLQDITAHVNFTALAEVAHAAGMQISGFTNQTYFLLGCGLLDIAEAYPAAGPVEQIRLAQEIKRLTLPGEMGERFKVLALGRQIEAPLMGFSLRDDRGRL